MEKDSPYAPYVHRLAGPMTEQDWAALDAAGSDARELYYTPGYNEDGEPVAGCCAIDGVRMRPSDPLRTVLELKAREHYRTILMLDLHAVCTAWTWEDVVHYLDLFVEHIALTGPYFDKLNITMPSARRGAAFETAVVFPDNVDGALKMPRDEVVDRIRRVRDDYWARARKRANC